MRYVLVLVGAIATTLACAGSAAAISVTSEPGGAACGTVSVVGHAVSQSGTQCALHMTSTELVDIEVFGATISSCNMEFDANVGSTGSGYIRNQTLTGASCAVAPCAEASGAVIPWPILFYIAGTIYYAVATYCLLGSSQTNCTVTKPLAKNGHSLSASGESPELNCAGSGGLIQIHGNWISEGGGVEFAP